MKKLSDRVYTTHNEKIEVRHIGTRFPDLWAVEIMPNVKKEKESGAKVRIWTHVRAQINNKKEAFDLVTKVMDQIEDLVSEARADLNG